MNSFIWHLNAEIVNNDETFIFCPSIKNLSMMSFFLEKELLTKVFKIMNYKTKLKETNLFWIWHH